MKLPIIQLSAAPFSQTALVCVLALISETKVHTNSSCLMIARAAIANILGLEMYYSDIISLHKLFDPLNRFWATHYHRLYI
jgi:hypothetical protein